MLLKVILVACIVASVTCQTPSDCTSTSFNFYNGYNLSTNFIEHQWDWEGSGFADGTSDTFDSYFYTDLTIDNVTYSVSNFYEYPVDYVCRNGTTDVDSASFASYTYNVTDTIQLHREFYAPRATTWLRVIDTVRNYGTTSVTVSLTYNGNYGSDSDTKWHELNDYYWVSSDGGNGSGDPPFSVNAAGVGGQIIPTKLEGDFVAENDDTSYTYNDVVVPAVESRSVMIVLGQYGDVDTAVAEALHIHSMPEEIYNGVSAPLTTIVNWDMCSVQIEVVNPSYAYCKTPVFITFKASSDSLINVNDSSVSMSNKQFTYAVVGNTQIQYQRQNTDCSARTVNFNFTLPSSNMSVAIDTSGTLPSVSATGGYGSYNYTWMLSTGGDLNNVFGGKATVIVSDKEGCTASAEIDVPELSISAPSVSGATRAIPFLTLIGFASVL